MPTTYSYYKEYSSVKRPFNKKTANYNRYFNKRVNTIKNTRANTARPKAEVNIVKAFTSWVWKPKHEELDHVFKSNSASKTLTRDDYVDPLGRVHDFVDDYGEPDVKLLIDVCRFKKERAITKDRTNSMSLEAAYQQQLQQQMEKDSLLGLRSGLKGC
nr:hypothetical protein [Tanacetum cinerariifolium]